ncbi:flagellar assembly protein FliW [Nocardioides humilatus]|uniref:Flagellar assembly factor FliW n=1 Tax=Nocardioides humilatus TaxID=2607660 RepID=A0A5B1LAP2_9ACTN|nr:flagellar assembly protein FliW [Nocardioides humilatus]KAA1417722.1 flagellar assembly protein FliW [Nocardioides humilatus]
MDAQDAGGAAADGVDLPVIELVRAMPGFPDDLRFALVRLDDAGVLHSFRSLSRDDLQFVVVPPAPFYPDYAPEVDDNVVEELGIASGDDVLVLLVVRAGQSLADTTVNLRAPLLVNLVTRRASQVILEDPDLPLAAPLVA